MGAQGTTTGRADVRERDDTAPLPATLHDDPARSDRWDPVDRLHAPAEAPLQLEPPPGPPVPQTRRPVPRTVWFFVVVGVLIVAMGLSAGFVIRALGDANPFKNGLVTQQTIDRSGPAVLKAVNDLGTFQAASGYYEVVIDVEHHTDHVPSFLSGSRILFVAAGNVDVSVDLAVARLRGRDGEQGPDRGHDHPAQAQAGTRPPRPGAQLRVQPGAGPGRPPPRRLRPGHEGRLRPLHPPARRSRAADAGS